ncbi:hypothetical protein LX32DRAFT_680906 [Colletotrichum zoysiae]|uniref:Uncharacterized protein n=1 Tax=Colletotrichum zoysiae TaxID=1216348 RepID=A0AAD9HM96_9PEZI|nr:hypothetical protein LX32DRAFT_680906 [Colletotrichum zoysiae]
MHEFDVVMDPGRFAQSMADERRRPGYPTPKRESRVLGDGNFLRAPHDQKDARAHGENVESRGGGIDEQCGRFTIRMSEEALHHGEHGPINSSTPHTASLVYWVSRIGFNDSIPLPAAPAAAFPCILPGGDGIRSSILDPLFGRSSVEDEKDRRRWFMRPLPTVLRLAGCGLVAARRGQKVEARAEGGGAKC